MFVGGTMIRHALHSCTVTATSGSVHGATTRSCLIAPPSFPLVLAADILRAGSEAVDLAAIAVPADKNLRAAATTHKQSARHFIGALRHINPQPSAVSSSLQPRADRACRRARASQGQALRVAAKTRPALTGPARDGCAIWRSGRKNARGAGRTKEWNLRTQYPNRYSTSPHPTGVAMFGIIPDRRSQALDAGNMAVALVQQPLALAAQTALVLLRDARHLHHPADLLLPAHERHQHPE